jgi:anti-anti-sigma factor
LAIDVENASDCAYVSATGSLGFGEARRLKREVDEALALGADRVVLDLRLLTHVDPVGIGAILGLDTACLKSGHSLEVVAPTGASGDMLRLLGGAGRLNFAHRPDRP